MNTLKRWRLTGIIIITILGFVLHYLFSWTDGSKIVGLFVPVNESVWEHLKLGYWSLVLFSIIEYLPIKNNVRNYYLAKTLGVLSLEMTIVIIFYGYTFIAHKQILLIDILAYILGVIACQYLTYKVFRCEPFSVLMNSISLAMFISLAVLFGVMTYYPPHIALFTDPRNKTYGINREK